MVSPRFWNRPHRLASPVSMAILIAIAASPTSAFVTILSGDEGAVDGVIDRYFTENSYELSIEPQGQLTAENLEFYQRNLTGRQLWEAANLSLNESGFRLEAAVSEDRGFDSYTGVKFDSAEDAVPDDATGVVYEDRTLLDGTTIRVPVRVEYAFGDTLTRSSLEYHIAISQPVAFSYTTYFGAGSEGGRVASALSMLGDTENRETIIDWSHEVSGPYFFESATVAIGTSAVTEARRYLPRQTTPWRTLLADAIDRSEYVETVSLEEGMTFSGKLPVGNYVLTASQSIGADGYDFRPSYSTFVFEATPIPEPAALTWLSLAGGCGLFQRHPGRRSLTAG